jgi:hypothetical protein
MDFRGMNFRMRRLKEAFRISPILRFPPRFVRVSQAAPLRIARSVTRWQPRFVLKAQCLRRSACSMANL